MLSTDLVLAHVGIASLWLPIVLSAVAVFLLASVMWMVVGHHKNDWRKLGNEDAVMDAVRGQAPEGGAFVFPMGCSSENPKEFQTPEFQAKWAKGPTGYLYVRKPGPMTMTPMLVQSIVFYLVVSTLVAHLATAACHAGEARGYVFHFVLLASWMSYALGMIWGTIRSGMTWRHTLLCMVDCLVYAAATAGIFAWRWPAA